MANEKRLIDAERLKRILKNFEGKLLECGKTEGAEAVKTIIKGLKTEPTVDAVEVVHGRWERVIPSKSAAKWSTKVSCSVCHRQGYTHHKYCPNCGAKMDGDGNG